MGEKQNAEVISERFLCCDVAPLRISTAKTTFHRDNNSYRQDGSACVNGWAFASIFRTDVLSSSPTAVQENVVTIPRIRLGDQPDGAPLSFATVGASRGEGRANPFDHWHFALFIARKELSMNCSSIRLLRFAWACFLLFLATPSSAMHPADSATPTIAPDDPLLQVWQGEFGGVPPWDKVQPTRLEPAFIVAIEKATRDIQAIANNTEAPTFDNTIAALEQAGQELRQLQAIFGVYRSNLNLGPIPQIEQTVGPMLAAYEDSITQNAALFARIEAVYQGEQSDWSPDRVRLVENRYKQFVRRGANLADDEKSRLSAINKRLAVLFAQFSQNVLADEAGYITWIEDSEKLLGLPDSLVAAMANSAEQQGQPGKWAVRNTRSSMDPFLTYAADRSLREQVWRNYYSRADHDDQHDNKAIIREILQLRQERAKLLGYATHAHWRLETEMAKTPENVMDLLLQIWPKAVARVAEEVADMQAVADKQLGVGAITIEPWDYRYYAEKVRKAKYDLDMNEVKPYLQLEKLREGMMWVAEQLYGMQFRELSGVPVFHPDVRVWEVTGADDALVGLFYLDPFAREGKRSGAWMTAYRVQDRLQSTRTAPLISNNSNFVKAAKDQPVLISWDDATTLFHEFGHALHGLCSDVEHPSQAGTAVARDFVEFPSQLKEHWLSTPEVLTRFAVHHETGEPMPAELLQKIEKAATFNQGFATVEYLASALIDMKLHLSAVETIDPDAFERDTLSELGMPPQIVMRHRTPHFAHIFSSDSYSAGYYSYLWADVLTADAAEAFDQAGSYFDEETVQRLYQHVMSVGDTIDPADSFRLFRGRDVDTSALLRKRGFPVQ